MVKKKARAQVWVETVIYTLVGLVIIAIILSTALPQINRAKDRNVLTQTINAMNDIDSKIQEVVQVPGNLGIVELRIAKGRMVIDSVDSLIIYTLEDTPLKYGEVDQQLQENGVTIITKKNGNNFNLIVTKNYTNSISITVDGEKGLKTLQPGATPYKLQIENIGDNAVDSSPHLDFRLVSS